MCAVLRKFPALMERGGVRQAVTGFGRPKALVKVRWDGFMWVIC